ncbi:hypothetical protein FACS1894132_14860 [Clostridia bacterium]|nr:hypothetical protein FACS1894132_14860 [Clostridia bacterium]
MTAKLLKTLMFSPTYEESSVFGAIPFTDGTITDTYGTLARKLSKDEINKKTLSHSLINVIKNGRGSNQISNPIYWSRGCFALSKVNKFQKFDVFLLELAYRLVVR